LLQAIVIYQILAVNLFVEMIMKSHNLDQLVELDDRVGREYAATIKKSKF